MSKAISLNYKDKARKIQNTNNLLKSQPSIPCRRRNLQKYNISNYDNKIEKNLSQNKNIVKSKNIICPKCGENALIAINDYKITLYDCKNSHKIENLLLKEYFDTQKIDLSKIICDECNTKNKFNTNNNEFYRCYSCKMNLCPECKIIHQKYKHNIIYY